MSVSYQLYGQPVRVGLLLDAMAFDRTADSLKNDEKGIARIIGLGPDKCRVDSFAHYPRMPGRPRLVSSIEYRAGVLKRGYALPAIPEYDRKCANDISNSIDPLRASEEGYPLR